MSSLAEQVDAKTVAPTHQSKEYAELILRCITSNQVSETDFAKLSALGKTPGALKGALTIEHKYKEAQRRKHHAKVLQTQIEGLKKEAGDKRRILHEARIASEKADDELRDAEHERNLDNNAHDQLMASIKLQLRKLNISEADFDAAVKAIR